MNAEHSTDRQQGGDVRYDVVAVELLNSGREANSQRNKWGDHDAVSVAATTHGEVQAASCAHKQPINTKQLCSNTQKVTQSCTLGVQLISSSNVSNGWLIAGRRNQSAIHKHVHNQRLLLEQVHHDGL